MAKLKTTTPLGDAAYAYIDKPDTKFDPDGSYKLDLILPLAKAQPILRQVEEMARKEFKGAKGLKFPWRQNEDEGTVIFRPKSSYKPNVVDRFGSRIDPDEVPRIGPGSKVKVSVTFQTYTTGPNKGVTAYLNAVQIGKLAESEFGDISDELEEDYEDEGVSEDDAEETEAEGDEDEAEEDADF